MKNTERQRAGRWPLGFASADDDAADSAAAGDDAAAEIITGG